MGTEIFVALVRRQDERYRAQFPDIPELSAQASDLVSLLNAAREVLDRELKRREAAGADWPTPTSVEDIQAKATPGVDTLMLVDVPVDDRPIRVNISIGERLLKRLDEVAEAKDMSRSGYIAASVRKNLGAEFSDRTAGANARSQSLLDEIAAVGRRMNDAMGAGSSFGRTLSELDTRALDGLRSLSALISARARTSPSSSDADANEASASKETYGKAPNDPH